MRNSAAATCEIIPASTAAGCILNPPSNCEFALALRPERANLDFLGREG